MMTAAKPTPVDHTLPDGWQRVCLGDVADVAFSGVDKRTVEGELPVQLCNYTDMLRMPFYTELKAAGRWHRVSSRLVPALALLLMPWGWQVLWAKCGQRYGGEFGDFCPLTG